MAGSTHGLGPRVAPGCAVLTSRYVRRAAHAGALLGRCCLSISGLVFAVARLWRQRGCVHPGVDIGRHRRGNYLSKERGLYRWLSIYRAIIPVSGPLSGSEYKTFITARSLPTSNEPYLLSRGDGK